MDFAWLTYATTLALFIIFTATFLALKQRTRAYQKRVLEEPLFAAAIADAAIDAIPLADAAATMNAHVFDAMDRWVVHSGSPWSLVEYVQNHHATVFAANDGFIDGLKGYVAESIVGDHFAALGHNVVLATTTNQPGWDLLIDGHPFQIKAGKTAVEAARHAIGRYPGIPIITDNQAAEQLGAIDPHSVVAVHEIGAQHLEATTVQTLHGLDAIGHAGQIHVPFITIGMSAFMEVRLLRQGHTTFGRAAANVALDAVGVGTGAAIGGKTGAMIGTVGHAPGMALGALIGTLIGAWSGKYGAKAIKQRNFKELRESYVLEVNVAARQFATEQRVLSADFRLKLCDLNSKLSKERRESNRIAKSAAASAHARKKKATREFIRAARQLQFTNSAVRQRVNTSLNVLDREAAIAALQFTEIVLNLRSVDPQKAEQFEKRLRNLITTYREADSLYRAAQGLYADVIIRHDLLARAEAATTLERLALSAKESYKKANELQALLVKESRAIGRPLALPST